MTVDDLLIEARGVLPHRRGPAGALAAQAADALLVDIRGADNDQRWAGGLVPGPLCCPATRWSGAAIPRHSGGTQRSTTGPGRWSWSATRAFSPF